ncbi:MAG TPA: protein-L-isoaspartate(D-aspartate) O-methyltransferase [Vicinamibacteria bacterium]|jgi:protein-L-isoaspartate(D-aspartate) O-methyltransferase
MRSLGRRILSASVVVLSAACTAGPAGEDWSRQRLAMVERQIVSRGISNPRVLEAMRTVPRHLFVPAYVRAMAYADHPLLIGEGQTISQPYIVAFMTELLDPQPEDKVLEVGTGSGYQAAVLAGLASHVYTIEILPSLAQRAEETLHANGYHNVTVITGDGYRGLPDVAPFDGIIVTAAPEEVPPSLLEQLAVGGRMVIPVGAVYQELQVIERTEKGFDTKSVLPVRFVPMTGESQKPPKQSRLDSNASRLGLLVAEARL